MSTADLLSQDEIDALLNGVDSGAVKTEDQYSLRDGVARQIDLGSQERVVRGRMPTLEMVNDRFARLFRLSLFNLLRKSPEITANEVKTQKFSEYVHSLPVPTSLNLTRIRPLRGTGLVVFDARLVFAVVNCFFGGDMKMRAKIEGRDFTATESRIVELLRERAFHDFHEAWGPVLSLQFDYMNTEMNPQFANIVTPSEIVVVCSFQIEIEGDGGQVQLVMPYSMVEPIRDMLSAGLQSDRDDVDDRWPIALREGMHEATVELSGTLAETRMTLSEVLDFKPGDVIPVDIPPDVVIVAEGVPVFRARYGAHHGSRAFQVTSILRRAQPSQIVA